MLFSLPLALSKKVKNTHFGLFPLVLGLIFLCSCDLAQNTENSSEKAVYNCGEQAISYIYENLGLDRELVHSGENELSLFELKELLAQEGIDSTFFETFVPKNEVYYSRDLLLLHLKSNHYIVVKRLTSEYFLLKDQGHNPKIVNFEEIKKNLSGYGLRIVKTCNVKVLGEPCVVGDTQYSKEVNKNSVGIFSFKIFNPINENIIVRKIHKPCSCLNMENLSNVTLEPNNILEINIQYTAPNELGDYRNSVIVETSKNNILVELVANVVDSSFVDADFLNFGALRQGVIKTEQLTFREDVKAEFIKLEANANESGQYDIKIDVNENRWSINLVLNEDYKQPTVRVYKTIYLLLNVNNELIKIPIFLYC